MGFDRRETAKTYTPADGDNLKSIAKRETDADNPLSWQDITRFNWGTDNPDIVEEFLRDEMGCYVRGSDNNYVFSSDCQVRTPLLIPQRYKRNGLSITRTHTLAVRKQPPPPSQFQACCKVSGINFEFEKSFIRASVVDELKKLEAIHQQFPNAKILIFGHTDKMGDDQYNKALSERRALSTYAFITNDAETWEMLYSEEDWNTRVIKEILKDLDDPRYDPGPVNNDYDERTRQAVWNYQEDTNGELDLTGYADPETRKHLFRTYMTGKHDVAITADQFMDPKHVGCGEYNPLEETEERNETNRRVTFYLFNPERLPNPPCQQGNSNPCYRQMDPPAPRHTPTFKCSFYDSIAEECPCEQILRTIELRLFDPRHEAIPNARYRLTVGTGDVRTGTADGNGCLIETDVEVPTKVKVEWDFPEDRVGYARDYVFELTVYLDAQAGEDDQTTQNRLHNLGYGLPSLRENVRAFQNDFDITPADGILTPETRASIREIHDNTLSKSEYRGN